MDRREAELLGSILGRPVEAAEPGCAESPDVPPSYREALGRLPGMVAINKPPGPTSHDVVALVRRALGKRIGAGAPRRGPKVGHSGTLDPAASGLLVMGLGAGTKLLPFLHGLEKEYIATVRFGMRTETDDLEGAPVGEANGDPAVAAEEIEAALAAFRGPIRQRAPLYSAIKRGGRPAYERARRGEEFEPAVRDVEISSLRLAHSDGRDAVLEVTCSAGTYIRSLARDIGEALGCGGVLAELRRTRVGPFCLADAIRPDEVGKIVIAGD